MRTITFSEADLALIAEQRLQHAYLHVRRKFEVLWPKSKGLSQVEIARITELG
jgi:hypothetical protein